MNELVRKSRMISRNIMTTAPYTVLQASIITYIITSDPVVGFFTLLVLAGEMFNQILKEVIRLIFPDSKWVQRPNPRGDGLGCGIYPESGRVSKSSGMPSGHSQTMGICIMFWTLYMRVHKGLPWKRIAPLWIMALSVVGHRVLLECHSIPQAITGFSVGLCLGAIGYVAVEKYIMKKKDTSIQKVWNQL